MVSLSLNVDETMLEVVIDFGTARNYPSQVTNSQALSRVQMMI